MPAMKTQNATMTVILSATYHNLTKRKFGIHIILIISRSYSILGTIGQIFFIELCPLGVNNSKFFAVSVHFLRRCLKGRRHKCFANISSVIDISDVDCICMVSFLSRDQFIKPLNAVLCAVQLFYSCLAMYFVFVFYFQFDLETVLIF